MARPKAEIDWEKVDKMLCAGCTGTGIAQVIGICEDTLYRACEETHKIGFSAYSQQKKIKGQDMFRMRRYQLAMEGNPTLIIWLSKVMLGEREGIDMKNEITQNINDEAKAAIVREILGELSDEQLRVISEGSANSQDKA